MASTARAAPTPAKFAVTFSATQTSTISESQCTPQLWLTLNAALSSVGPITATLKGSGALTFTPTIYKPLRATVSVSMAACLGSASPLAPRTCGPATVMLRPGLEPIEAAAGLLQLRYGTLYQIFPDSDSCSSGLMNLPSRMTAPLNPSSLLQHHVTTVAGTWTDSHSTSVSAGSVQDQTVVKFTVQFVRLP